MSRHPPSMFALVDRVAYDCRWMYVLLSGEQQVCLTFAVGPAVVGVCARS
jgi:hypothetical protein